MNRFKLFNAAAMAFVLVAVAACSPPPAPRKTITPEGKNADLYWLFAQFNEYYAPLEYKEKRLGFNYEQLKSKTLAEAQTTKTNEEFYEVMYRFVSTFADAHTSASLSNASLPGRAKAAYLGFSGKRVGERLKVTELLPTFKAEAEHFPVKVGDYITKLNGKSLREVALTEMAKWRNLGHDEANFTYHAAKIFNRVSTSNGLPTGDTAVLTLVRKNKEYVVELPWVVKDLLAFSNEQKAASKPANKDKERQSAGDKLADAFEIGFLSLDGRVLDVPFFIEKIIRGLPEFKFWRTFRFIDSTPVWAQVLGDSPATSFETLSKSRKVPDQHVRIDEAKTYPAYVSFEKVYDAAGKETGRTRPVGYIWLNTFSPEGKEEAVVAEVQATLEKFRLLGANDVIIDLINNGGGSLILGMKLAQLLSAEKVVQPDIQLGLSETWFDSFERESLKGGATSEDARRAFEALREDLNAGKRLSRRMSVEHLAPYQFQPNEKLEKKFNVVLLVNEMCASMCDIYSAILKDNGLARIVGSKTMGAGGNVVEHYMAPVSHMTVRQTESLIVRRDGSYIENNGIEPDVALDVTESADEKYSAVRERALKLLLTETK